MDSARWEKIQVLFHLAVVLSSDEQKAFLDLRCAEDPSLADEVRRLLEEDARHDSLLDGNVSDLAARVLDDRASPRPPFHKFGPYRIVRKVGEGGMGIVYLAQREDLGNEVAIKFLRDAWLSPARRRRFAVEQRTLARLNHPSIARLYDADTSPDGTPFFVMEYFEGVPLTQYCARHQLSPRERLLLLRTVCEALVYAHGHGVLHYDLKPSNILVKDDQTIRLLDFGIAKPLDGVLESAERTLTGLRLMTPAYAAPERIRGGLVGVKTDIYSLGVILYELLTGQLPFDLDDRTPAQAEKILTDSEAEKPSALRKKQTVAGPGVPLAAASAADWADLDVLCMTAMHKDVDRRYASAEALIRDIDHYLRQEPLEARPDSLGYRAGKFLSRNRRVAAAVVFGCAAVAATVLLMLGLGLRPGNSFSPTGSAAPRITSLVVLPLANASGQVSQEYLADGMTGGLINDLSKVRALKVISETSAMRYKNTKKTAAEIARDLQVNCVVEGSVASAGGRLRLDVRLIEPATNKVLWSETYDRNLQDVPSMQRELALDILQRTGIPIRPSEELLLSRVETTNPQAHDLYLRGRYFWNQRTQASLFKSLDYFRQAIQADPNYPQAYAGLADAYVELVGFGHLNPAEGIPEAKKAALKAIAMDSTIAEGYDALAYCEGLAWNWAAAQKDFQRAVELNPGYVTALYQYAFFLSTMGKQLQAILMAKQAVELDPLSSVVLYRAGRVYLQARRYKDAAQAFRRILELNPTDPLGNYGLGLDYVAEGRPGKAIPYLEKENFEQSFDLDAAYAAAGQRAEARRRIADEVQLLQKERAFIRPGCIAEAYAALGDKDDAIRWLQRGYQERDPFMILLKVWPAYDPLRSDPRFQALVRQMNFPG